MELLEGMDGGKYVYVPEVDEVMPLGQFEAWMVTPNEDWKNGIGMMFEKWETDSLRKLHLQATERLRAEKNSA